MLSYESEATPPEPAAPPSSPSSPPAPGPARKRPVGAAVLLAVALSAGAVGGGVAGAAGTWAALHRLPPPPATALPAAAQPVSVQGQRGENVAGAVFGRVGPAVVQIVTSGQSPAGPARSGSGSGFVVDARGLVLTNQHVVAGARAVSVRFSTGAVREAQILGTDRGNDLALLKVDLPPNVPVAPLGDSDEAEVGEVAIAIGSPFGLDQTVTQGIISAVRRTWQPGNGRARRNLLQTDAPINPGNSGGPLLNANGEVIGINNMIESPVRGSVGVGFAVPINIAKRLLPQLEAGADLQPVWLGITGQEVDQTIARDQGLPAQAGVLVLSVVPGSPAAQAGLRGGQGADERIPRGGDVITAIDRQPIRDMTQLTEQLAGHKPGDVVRVTIVRGGQEQQVSVTLQAWPEETR